MRKLTYFTLSVLVLASMILASCTTPTPETIIQTVEVEKEVKVVETKEVEVVKEVEVTKEVVVKEEVVVEVTPVPSADEVVYERNETLYTSGTQWGPPSNWNPFVDWGHAMGTVGFCYETLFLFDPMTGEYLPWLAESGEWTSDDVFTVKLREGINWSDGEPMTAADVVLTVELGKLGPSTKDYVLWNWLESAVALDDYTVEFSFSDPLYQEWGNWLYSRAIVPKHLWEDSTEEEVSSGANENPIGSGPYLYETHNQDRMVWLKNDNWWAKDLLGLDVAPKRVVDIVNGSNNVALGLVLQGGLDLSNNFLPGIATLVGGGYGIQTYYPDPPYMLSANTAWLLMNNTIAPMDDPEFRRAVAYAIDVSQIVEVVYGNIVMASDPTGLLPSWNHFIDQDVVDELGFSYNPDMAAQLLANAGYVDVDGDGFVDLPDGTPFDLSIIVPFGWTDWMESIKVIADGCQAVGINLQTEFPDYGGYTDARNSGTYDMCISNDKQIADTPWTYYDWLFQNPILDTMTNGNYSRYENQVAFDLVDELDKIPVDDIEGMKAIMSDLQRIQLEDMPYIPLWFNGMWSQVSNAVWTNWPASAEDANHYLPCTWRGYWNMTGILMLTELELAPAE
jgi:peptide/nickel transport system substrate-binding protein